MTDSCKPIHDILDEAGVPPSDLLRRVSWLVKEAASSREERDKARDAYASAVGPDGATTMALDAINELVGCGDWEYPGQLVRDVQKVKGERDAALAEIKKLREAGR